MARKQEIIRHENRNVEFVKALLRRLASLKTYRVPHTDLVVSRIAYGCLFLVDFKELLKTPLSAAAFTRMVSKISDEPLSADTIAKAACLIHTAHDSGITFFDHADGYGAGKCEEVFGEVLKQSPGLRNKVVIQSKCGIRFAEDPPGDPARLDCRDNSRAHIVSSAEGILRRLGTDYLDILLLHMPDALVEPDEVARAFDDLQQSGKVRHFGVSNHTAAQIELLKKCVRQPLVANQIHLGLEHSYPISDGMEANREGGARVTHSYTGVAGTFDYCRLHDIQIQAFSPLRANHAGPPNLLDPPADAALKVKQAAQVVVEVAKRKNVPPSAVVLAWLLHHPVGIVPIIGTISPERVIENCLADRVTLSREEWYTLLGSAAKIPAQ